MSFLLDTDICSAHLRGNRDVTNRYMLHLGRLYLSALTLGELLSWIKRSNTSLPARRRRHVAGRDSIERRSTCG